MKVKARGGPQAALGKEWAQPCHLNFGGHLGEGRLKFVSPDP